MLKCFIATVVALMLCSPLYSAQPQTLVDGDGKAVGTAANPLYISGGGGSAEGWDAEGDGIVFDSTTYTDGLTISDVNVTLDNTSITILNTDGVLDLTGSIAISESLSANDFWVTSDDSTIAFDDAVSKPQIIVNGKVLFELSESGVNVNILGDVDIDGSLTLGNILTQTGSHYYLIIDNDGNVFKQAM